MIWKQNSVALAVAPLVRTGRDEASLANYNNFTSLTQCARKRDTEWTCGAFCADIDSASCFFNLTIYTTRIKTFWSIKSIETKSFQSWHRDSSRRILAKNCDFPYRRKVQVRKNFETKDCFVVLYIFATSAKLCSKKLTGHNRGGRKQ